MRMPVSVSSLRFARRVGAVWCGLLVACGSADLPNVLLVSFDTLRADHLGVYGYPRDTSPHLDAFASEAVRYERAYAPAPWTLPSHAAMLSGLHPYALGIVNLNGAIPGDATMLAEVFGSAGYQTAAFVDSSPRGLLGAQRGFDRGFDVYRHAPHSEAGPYNYDARKTVEAGLAWLEARDQRRPFFLFLHTKSVHTAHNVPPTELDFHAPYHTPRPFRTRFLPDDRTRFRWQEDKIGGGGAYLRLLNQRIAHGQLDPAGFPREQVQELVDLYDGGIRFADAEFGRLLVGLEALGLSASTIVAATADHGEAFLEHRFFLHNEVYDPLLHVPLLIRDPRTPGAAVVSRPVELMDLAGMLLERAGLAPPAAFSRQRLSARDGEEDGKRAFFHYYRLDGRYGDSFAMREGSWKLVYQKLPHWPGYAVELFDLAADPRELHPVTSQPDRAQQLLARLEAWLAEQAADSGLEIELDPDTVDQLRSLGYVP